MKKSTLKRVFVIFIAFLMMLSMVALFFPLSPPAATPSPDFQIEQIATSTVF